MNLDLRGADRQHLFVLRSLSACVSALLIGCTPIRPLDAPSDGSTEHRDAGSQQRFDASVDSGVSVEDAATDSGPVDACYAALPDLCNGADDDCDPTSADGSEDPMVGTPCDGADADLCNEGTSVCVDGAIGCDDATDDTLEVCSGGTGDEDCDGTVDEDGAEGSHAYYPDGDSDSYGVDAGARMACERPRDGRWETRGGDCDDTDSNVNPGRAEQCNGIDDDCDAMIDDGNPCSGCATLATGGRVFQVCTRTMSWSAARSECMSMGYDLAVVDEAEYMALVSALMGAGGFSVEFWIGLSRPGASAPLTWVDGTPVTFADWSSGEPDGSGDCGAIQRGLTGTLGWVDDVCSESHDFICELP